MRLIRILIVSGPVRAGCDRYIRRRFLLLFDKETSFDDINAVTSTLKALKDSFDNRENYKDSNEGNIIAKKK